LLGSIYDEAWASIAAGYVQADRETREGARVELAAIMLRLAEEQLEAGDLKNKAMRLFKRASAPGWPSAFSRAQVSLQD
jgi:hypothetical protein